MPPWDLSLTSQNALLVPKVKLRSPSGKFAFKVGRQLKNEVHGDFSIPSYRSKI